MSPSRKKPATAAKAVASKKRAPVKVAKPVAAAARAPATKQARAPRTVAEFMVVALVMESEAAQRPQATRTLADFEAEFAL